MWICASMLVEKDASKRIRWQWLNKWIMAYISMLRHLCVLYNQNAPGLYAGSLYFRKNEIRSFSIHEIGNYICSLWLFQKNKIQKLTGERGRINGMPRKKHYPCENAFLPKWIVLTCPFKDQWQIHNFYFEDAI